MILQVVTFDAFADAFGVAASHRSEIAESCSDPVDVEGTNYVLSLDGLSGFAVRPDGELVLVFSTAKGRGDTLVQVAMDVLGADHLDCFDGYLSALYSAHGFDRVTSLPNWTPGEPDVVYMARPGQWLKALEKAESSI